MQILKLKDTDMGLFIEGRKERLFVDGCKSKLNCGRTILMTPDMDQGEIAYIKKIEYVRFADITIEDSRLAGFEKRLDLIQDFLELYPTAQLIDTITCIHLERE